VSLGAIVGGNLPRHRHRILQFPAQHAHPACPSKDGDRRGNWAG
jgi:hypothetical protein